MSHTFLAKIVVFERHNRTLEALPSEYGSYLFYIVQFFKQGVIPTYATKIRKGKTIRNIRELL